MLLFKYIKELPLNKYTQVKLPCQNSMDQKKEISHSYLESLKSNTIQYVSFFFFALTPNDNLKYYKWEK